MSALTLVCLKVYSMVCMCDMVGKIVLPCVSVA